MPLPPGMLSVGGFALKTMAWLWRRAVRVIRGSPEEQAYASALAAAVQAAIAAHAPPDPDRLSAILDRGAVGEMLIQVVRAPLSEVDLGELRTALAEQGYVVNDVRLDLRALVDRIRDEFLLRLPESDAGRAPHVSARVEQIHVAVARIEARSMGSTLTAGEIPAGLAAVAKIYEDARAQVRAGRYSNAGVLLDSVLRSLSEAGESIPAEQIRPLRQRVLLSKAQVAIKQGDSPLARELLNAAREIGAFTGARRELAGWVLLNLGDAHEARAVLAEEFDGSDNWRQLRAVAALEAGEYNEFVSLTGGEHAAHDRDVLAALVRHHVQRGAYQRAAALLDRLVATTRTAPADWVHPINAGVTLLAFYAATPDPEPFDVAPLITVARGLLDEVRPLEESLGAPEQEMMRWNRARFHQVLFEWDAARAAWANLAASAPRDAARLLAASIRFAEERPEAARRLASAADSEIDRCVLEAHAALANGDMRRAVDVLTAGAAVAQSTDERDRLLAMALEARTELGESVPALLGEAECLVSRTTRALIRTALHLHVDDPDSPRRALDEVERGLADAPRDLQLLRTAADLALQIVNAPATKVPADLRGRAQAFACSVANALVDRLPCPEHRLLQVYALRASGSRQAAYDVVRAVEAEGYATARTAGLVADLSRDLGRMREHAEAAARYHREFGRTARTALAAGEANLIAEQYDVAGPLLEEAARTDDEDIAARAVIDLARLAERQAARDGRTGTQDLALDRMLQEYARLPSPALASALLFQALGGPREAEVLDLVARDFGAVTALPGWTVLSLGEVAAMREARGSRHRGMEFLWRAGVLPFESYARAVGTSTPVVWTAHHRAGAYLATEPPPLVGGFRRALGIHQDDDPERDNRLPAAYLVDETALFTLATIGALDAVLQAPALRGRLFVEADTHQRMQEVGVSDAPGEAERRVRARHLAAAAREASPLDLSTTATLVDDSPEESDAGTVREQHGSDDARPTVQSRDVAGALLTLGYLDVERLAAARRVDPATFPGSLVGLVPVNSGRPLAVDASVLTTWEQAGVLDALSAWPPGLVMEPTHRQFLLDAAERADVEEAGLELARTVARAVTAAIESGHVCLVPAPPGLAAIKGTKGDADGGIEMRADEGRPHPGDAHASRAERLARVLAPTERRLAIAAAHDALLWSDDLSAHIAVDVAGPFIVGEPELHAAVARLQEQYGGIRVFGTSAVLAMLTNHDVIDTVSARRMHTQLVRARHWYVLDAATVAAAALADNADESAVAVLSYMREAPMNLLPEAAFRSAVAVAAAAAGALGHIAATQTSPAAIRRAVERAVAACLAWTDERLLFSRFACTTFWRALGTQLMLPSAALSEMFAAIFDALTTHWPASRPLADSLADALDVVLQIAASYPDMLAQAQRAMAALATNAARAPRPDGRSLLPVDALRLAAGAVGLSSGIIIRTTRKIAMPHGAAEVTYEIDSAEIRNAGLAAIDMWLSPHLGGPTADVLPDDLAEHVAIERPACEPEMPPQLIRWPVDRTLALIDATGQQRAVLAELVAREHEAKGAPELATLARDAAPAMSVEGDEGTAAVSRYFRALFDAPRTWLHEDPIRAVQLLRGAPLTHLVAMVGGMPVWRAGETVVDYANRIGSAEDVGLVQRETLKALLGGPQMALTLTADQLRRALAEPSGDVSSTESGNARQSKVAGALLAAAVMESDPYSRVTALLGAIMVAWGNEAVCKAPLDVSHLAPAVRQQLTPVAGTPLRDLIAAALAAALAPEPERERLEDDIRGSAAGVSPSEYMDRLGRLMRAHDALHAEAVRAALAAVLTPAHLAEVAECWPAEAAQELLAESGAGPSSAPDHLGTLLALSRALGAQLYRGAVEAAVCEGDPHVLRAALARRLAERDFARQQYPSAELFLPDVLGPDPDRADPYRSTLLFALEELLETARTQSGENEMGAPFWFSADVRAALEAIAACAITAGERELLARAARQEVEDRFLSPCRLPLAERAQRVLAILGGRSAPEATFGDIASGGVAAGVDDDDQP